MMRTKIKKPIGSALIYVFIFMVAGCGTMRVMTERPVPGIPDAAYERIIRLNNPEGNPDRSLAGVVHITGKATVCTDYPREEPIKSLDDLTSVEKTAYRYFRHYAVGEGDLTAGYVSIPVDYWVNVWRLDDDPACRYKIQIIPPRRGMGNVRYEGVDKSVFSW